MSDPATELGLQLWLQDGQRQRAQLEYIELAQEYLDSLPAGRTAKSHFDSGSRSELREKSGEHDVKTTRTAPDHSHGRDDEKEKGDKR
jgi:hypothetical protein